MSRRLRPVGSKKCLVGWRSQMLGAVAPTLLWPSGVVQHAGIVLGPNFGIGHAFSDRVDGECGYADLLAIAHESSAAASACLLTRRRLFLEVGGFNSRNFPSEYGDVDYCLKLRAKGHRIVTTPYARLIRHNAPLDVNGRKRRTSQSSAGVAGFAVGMGRGPSRRSLLQSTALARFHPILRTSLAAAFSSRPQTLNAAG